MSVDCPLRDPPRLRLEIPLEGSPEVRILCESDEDSQRIRGWLVRSGVWDRVSDLLVELEERNAA
jgi:hypothetical protein